MANNLRSIFDCLFAAGIQFIDGNEVEGEGVRFRHPKIEYLNSIKIDRIDRCVKLHMRYSGREFVGLIPFNLVNDFCHTNFSTDDEYRNAVSEMLHRLVAAAERSAGTGISDGKLLFALEMLE